MHFAGVAIGSVISLASAPLASGLLELLLERRRLSLWWALAAGLGIIGSTLLCLSKMTDAAESTGQTVAGIALGLIAGATYATYSWAAHHLMNHSISRAAAMGSVFGLGGMLLLPVLIVNGAPLLASAQAFSVAVYMAIIPMFLGYLLFGFGLTRVSASTATTITLTEPAIPAILALLIVGERLTTVGWIGFAVIACVLVVLAIAPTNESESKSTPSSEKAPKAGSRA
ncbi:EamA family transporter [Cryobacterium sp. Y50]|uniref:EamA family transporter n=1 Tax=Cryobacterium sp. Y50 TaxID=2048286 RepID=UPI000CE40C17